MQGGPGGGSGERMTLSADSVAWAALWFALGALVGAELHIRASRASAKATDLLLRGMEQQGAKFTRDRRGKVTGLDQDGEITLSAKPGFSSDAELIRGGRVIPPDEGGPRRVG